MGQATSKGNEAKLNMKQPLDMPTPRFELGGSDLWSNTLPLEWSVHLYIQLVIFMLHDIHKCYMHP